MNSSKKDAVWPIIGIYLCWILISYFVPYLNRLYNVRKINLWILPAFRMTLLFLITCLFIRLFERQSFSSGFNFRFQNIGKNILWAIVFFVIAGAIMMPLHFFVLKSLLRKSVEVSSAMTHGVVKSFMERLIEYIYIVYEGFVEVLIFIGFLLDRLVKKWGWATGLIVSNIGFALWHFNYWRTGLLEGSLMISLVFIMGILDSLCYMKTRNSLGPVICHTFHDSPNSIRILLGLM